MSRLANSICSLCLLLTACNSTPPAETPTAETTTARSQSAKDSGLAMHSEVGALDASKVKEVFSSATGAIKSCFDAGAERVSTLDGEMEILLRISGEGTVRYAVPLKSSFGDRETERCMLGVLDKLSWPKPKGGDEGITTQRFDIRTVERAAVAWTPRDLGRKLGKLQTKLRSCQKKASAPWLSVTINVDEDGRPLAAGAATGDEHGLAALDCAVSAAKSLRYPWAGSWPAKVTVKVD